MRTSVVVLAAVLAASAATLMWSGTPHTDQQSARQAPAGVRAAEHTDRIAAAHATVDAIPTEAATATKPGPAMGDRYPAKSDQYEAFEMLRRSSDADDLFVAAAILHDCYLDTRDTYQVGTAIAGRPLQSFASIDADGSVLVRSAPATPEQVDAARELLRRCAGFRAMTLAAYRSLGAEVAASLLRSDSPVGEAEAIAIHRMLATPARLRAILASRNPIALLLIDRELAERWQRHSNEPTVAGMFGAPSPALQLAACDLGMDCGVSSRLVLTACLDRASACGLDVAAQIDRAASPSSAPTIARLHDRFAEALAGGNYAICGL